MIKISIGCIADDFTGAGDAASFLQKGGLRTVLTNGIPSGDLPLEDGQAVVIALKTRNLPADCAVKESLLALEWLLANNTGQIYLKYCSTFDSAPTGNIGPVIDAFLQRLKIRDTLLCPALPVNKRTVRDGCLFVDGIPLHKSSMKNHPLTPMWDCRIPALMEKQGAHPCLILNRKTLETPTETILGYVEAFAAKKDHFYIIPEYENQNDAEKIVRTFGNYRLLTGGSGLLEELARRISSKASIPARRGVCGRNILILAGSCSAMTLKQIKCFQKGGGNSIHILPSDLTEENGTGEDGSGETAADILISKILKDQKSGSLLLYTSDTPDKVKEAQGIYGSQTLSALFETFLSRAALFAYQNGCRNFIIAGGETSGAVTEALGFQSFLVGQSISPGIPLLIPVGDQSTRLLLKSGNFGSENFFKQASLKLEAHREENYECK